jgi:hypothetical protein
MSILKTFRGDGQGGRYAVSFPGVYDWSFGHFHQAQWPSSPRETAAAIRLAVRAASAQHSNRPL